MTSETIVAVYNTIGKAEAAIRELESSGIPKSSIEHYSKDDTSNTQYSSDVSETGNKGGGFWQWLLGEESTNDQTLYNERLTQGDIVVTVIADPAKADNIITILEKHHPIDLDEHGAIDHTGTSSIAGTSTAGSVEAQPAALHVDEVRDPLVGTPTTRATDAPIGNTGTKEVIPLREEQLDIGKRQVQTGTTRLRRYATDRPVEEQVRLRQETARVTRRPATGSTDTGEAFSEKTIEVPETREEPVVSKTTRVAEEVVVDKDTKERVETVRDNVRKEDVDISGGTAKGTTTGQDKTTPANKK